MTPLISICIPAYKRVDFLRRLLDSIQIQTFKNYEVVITDDSNDESVKDLSARYTNSFSLVYAKNNTSLGTPANWNEGIRLAKGEWIKIMHDDDWFSNENSLQVFADYIITGKSFIFSSYNNVNPSSRFLENITLSKTWSKRIINNPEIVFALNVIGPPSVTMLHRSIQQTYDERLKWRVDQEFYIRILRQVKDFTYIPTPLVNIGISDTQVTESSKNNPSVEIPEAFIMFQLYGTASLKNILIYDIWWRLFRNMNITTEATLLKYSSEKWPKIIHKMMKDIHRIPRKIRKVGIISKTFMTLSFLINRSFAD